ncbi:MAG: hypothetical protein JNM52_05965 [Betaproteobacteria bacterium]|nr:hypothetical protein [Betaproteobacteria bacterium]
MQISANSPQRQIKLFKPPPIAAGLRTGGYHRRILEWALVITLFTILIAVLGNKVREYQSLIEFSSVRYSLGSLRSAMAIHFLQEKTSSNHSQKIEPHKPVNPFLFLERLPNNYAGETSASEAKNTVPPGYWFFDSQCSCIGYHVMYTEEFNNADGSETLLISVTPAEDGKGPYLLVSKQTYRWYGEVM